MQGQWLVESPDNAFIMNVEIDENGAFYEGRAYVFSQNTDLVIAANIRGTRENFSKGIPIFIEYYARGSAIPLTLDEVKTRFSGSEPKFKAQLKLVETDAGLRATLSYEDGSVESSIDLPRNLAATASVVVPDETVSRWSDFKAVVSNLEKDRYIFRGQTAQRRLRTAFHRTVRKNLFTYVNQDIPKLHRALSPHMKHYFNLADSHQYGAFWSLAQHHGFPTPLLDWTYSPYVAAYFAFRHRSLGHIPIK